MNDESKIVNKICQTYKNCAVCCYRILGRYNLLTDAHHIIGLEYKFLLTLSVTQVACERSFLIILKYVKSRLGNSPSQDLLEHFMLMAIEKEILRTLDVDTVIDRVAEKSKLLQKLLITAN